MNKNKVDINTAHTAKHFLAQLNSLKSAAEKENNGRFFFDRGNKENKCLGVRFANIFKTAKDHSEMPINEIEELLNSNYYEVRMGAVSIMDFQARNKKTSDASRKALYELYIRRHDRINNWDLVDRSAPYVVGGYLSDKPRKILYKLAASKDPWQRRTAIVSTYFFIRQNDLSETFKIGGLLATDPHELVQKAVGSWIREAGKRDKKQLITFLNKYAKKMPRTMLRYAVEKLDKKNRDQYLDK
jgi:3-methyladenine DNA glycosylase AlkD